MDEDGKGPVLSPRAQQLKEEILGEFSLTVDDVAGILEVDRSTVYRYIQDGALAALKIGREYRLSDADVEGFLQALITRERQRVAELRVKALTTGGGGPAAMAAVPTSEPRRAPQPQAAVTLLVVDEPGPATPAELGQMGPMPMGAQGAAQWEARRTGHSAVHPAHVLLALVSDRQCMIWDRPFPDAVPMRCGMARQALERVGAEIPALRSAAEALLPPPDQTPDGGTPNRDIEPMYRLFWGPSAREAMASLGRRWLGTDAVLLALYRDEALAEVLRSTGADEAAVRAELQKMANVVGTRPTDGPRFAELATHAGQLAAQRAWERGGKAIEPEDLLLALLADDQPSRDGVAYHALLTVGADLAAIRTWAEARLGPAAAERQDGRPDEAPIQPNPGLRTVVFERAVAAARGLGHGEVGTEHLLLGLYSIPEIADRMEQAHASHADVRAAIRRLAPVGAPQLTEHRPLFGRYGERAQKVIIQAQELARRRGIGHVSTELLMLALLADNDLMRSGVARKALDELGVNVPRLRAKVEALLPAPAMAAGHKEDIAFTPRGKAMIMEHAITAARTLGHAYVGTEHLLLAAYEASERLPQVLEEAGAVREGVEAAILRLSGGGPAEVSMPQHPEVGSALQLAEKRGRSSGHAVVQPGHILLGLLDLEGVAARGVLERLQVDLAGLEAAVSAAIPRGKASGTVPAAGGGSLSRRIPLNADAKNVLARAASAASAGGATQVGTEHLLLALHASPTSEISQILTAAGAPEDAIAVELARPGSVGA